MTDILIRDVTTIGEFRQVVELEQAIWGYADSSDLVTVPVFIFTVHRGATLIGAFDAAGAMVGFAYGVVGLKHGRPMQWSHMAGVLPAHRGGLGYRLKIEQRQRVLAQGLDLIEWTFDPMQTMNAHFNFAKLGGVAEEYAENFYGESTSALHRGTPTDRLVLSWNIAAPHVVRRLEQASTPARSRDVEDAPVVNPTVMDGRWRKVASVALTMTDRRVWVEIPEGFTEMQQQAPARAVEWRLHVRAVFQEYFGRGYRAVDFVVHRDAGFGRYLLARED